MVKEITENIVGAFTKAIQILSDDSSDAVIEPFNQLNTIEHFTPHSPDLQYSRYDLEGLVRRSNHGRSSH